MSNTPTPTVPHADEVWSVSDFPWRACDLGEQPWDGETPFCCEPCSGCLVEATVELNKLNPLTTDPDVLGQWHAIIAVTSGEVVPS
jgi:hypothetical protein